MKDTAKVYFPGLNGLRFIAAVAVIFTHVELMKKFLGHGSHWIILDERVRRFPFEEIRSKSLSWLSPMIANAGPLGVVFFFVLSGFLITYLLLREKEAAGFISIRKFYLRRIYRIWPLYFLVTLLGFLVLPHIAWFDVPVQERLLKPVFWESFILCIIMLPNLAFAMFNAPPNIGQTWSIGVEEQFYVIWPWLVRKSGNLFRTIVIFVSVFMAIKLCALVLDHYTDLRVFTVLRKFFAMSRLESMAVGALGALYLFEQREKMLRVIYAPVTQIVSYLAIPVLVFFTPVILLNVIHLVYSVVFLVIILNISTNPRSIVRLNSPVFDYLGRISYGIYMYHIMVIVFVIHMYQDTIGLNADLTARENLLVYGTSVLLTIILSSLSYHFFEEKFIRRKRRLSVIVSGDDARQ
jgi:peptidoglycan/LPS O-acetylase OafA/YrhL